MTGLMVQLDERRAALGIPKQNLAAALGVSEGMPRVWAKGRFGPRFPAALAYARLVEARVVLTDGSQGLAEGAGILTALPGILAATGVTHTAMGRRMGIHRRSVSGFANRPGDRNLNLVEAYADGLGLWLEAVPLTPVSPGTGNTEEGPNV